MQILLKNKSISTSRFSPRGSPRHKCVRPWNSGQSHRTSCVGERGTTTDDPKVCQKLLPRLKICTSKFAQNKSKSLPGPSGKMYALVGRKVHVRYRVQVKKVQNLRKVKILLKNKSFSTQIHEPCSTARPGPKHALNIEYMKPSRINDIQLPTVNCCNGI